ncbi:Rieske 2Fe-2S domain-containing protein [Actinocorallia sp. A-T 12471]|uniref:Rieske 2Fe-2S domain-containing protein n=1 Tax=Actinocorallia sp. A-T 12471 TaxID=3089813 RepID=UPI0029CF1CBA|nr:Rieske 2Fe-2S domain-containing protein [Actinocorallia sp. A-T 12471]MDX6744122.1 Rieske 2Fe-2S domain-containing protein [Actinocorallia sp. A-T 12471]
MSAGIRVAAVADIPEGEGLKIDRSLTGTDDHIALLHDTDGSIWALDDTCLHGDASLSEGWVEDGCVECPLHTSKFCLKDGKVQGLPATEDQRPHRVEVRDGEVYLFPGEAP